MIFLFHLLLNTAGALPAMDWLQQPALERLQIYKSDPESYSRTLRFVAFDGKSTMQLRWRAVTTMGRVDHVRFRKDLERALASPEWFMRNSGLIAILGADRGLAQKWTLKLLQDKSLVVRTQAVRNVIALNLQEARAELWSQIWSKQNFIGRESLWVRAHMAEALARFAQPGQTGSFRRLLEDKDDRLHKWAIQGLEVSTGMRLGDSSDPLEVHRDRWLTRLEATAI